MSEIGHVREIVRYPVKSMAGIPIESAMLGWHGLEGDRWFAFRRLGVDTGFPWRMIKRVLWAVVVLACAPDDGTSRSSILNPQMQRALDQFAPGFQRFAASEYAAGVDTTYRAGGDFNGDGTTDVALYGRDETRELLLVLLSAGTRGYDVIPLLDRPFSGLQNGAYIYLRTRPAGPLEIPAGLRELLDPAPPERLEHAGIEVGYGNEASEIYYWNGTRFVSIQTGD